MDDRQSNLGDLMDGIENDRERTRGYMDKIQALEDDNEEKQRKVGFCRFYFYINTINITTIELHLAH